MKPEDLSLPSRVTYFACTAAAFDALPVLVISTAAVVAGVRYTFLRHLGPSGRVGLVRPLISFVDFFLGHHPSPLHLCPEI